jgi:small-conductance mechanosensitive channel
MIPSSIIFESEVINYNHKDNVILDEVTTTITYESNLEKAEEMVKHAAETILAAYKNKFPKHAFLQPPHTRLQFRDSGIDVTVRYHTIATQRNKITTDIRREIYRDIKRSSDIEFAYPHTEILIQEKKNRT